MTDEETDKEVVSSFNGIKKTLLHLWDVENIWWQRLKLTEVQVWKSDTYKGSLMDLSNQTLLIVKGKG